MSSLRTGHLLATMGGVLPALLVVSTWLDPPVRKENSLPNRLLVIQIIGLHTGDGGWQLLVVPHHHQLVEAQLERDEGLWLHTLAGLVP